MISILSLSIAMLLFANFLTTGNTIDGRFNFVIKWILVITGIIMCLVALETINSERNYLLNVIYENNITISSKYADEIKDIKIDNYSKSLEKPQ